MIGEEWNTMIPLRKWRPCVLHITGIGRHLNGSDHYDGSVPQYIFWFNYWRQTVLGLPQMRKSAALRLRLLLLAALGLVLGPALAALDALPGPYAWKFNLMRLRRQLAWAVVGGW